MILCKIVSIAYLIITKEPLKGTLRMRQNFDKILVIKLFSSLLQIRAPHSLSLSSVSPSIPSTTSTWTALST